jgi:hypothetical protein
MTAALVLTPELQAAMQAAADAAVARAVAQVQLALVPPATPPHDDADAARGLSMLRESIARRACERRQADAARDDRITDRIEGLSMIPASIRRREWERKRAAAKKAAIRSDRSDPLDLQPVTTEKDHSRRSPSDRSETGPLTGDLTRIVDRVSGYAESARKRDLAWLYREAARIFSEELGLRLPERWSGPKDWGAAKALIRDWKPDELLAGIKTSCEKWKLLPGKWSRPTLGLVLYHLRQGSPAAAPARPDDRRRLTGEQLEERDRKRARGDAASTKDPRTAPSLPSNRERIDGQREGTPATGAPREAAARSAGSGGCAAGTPSPAIPAPSKPKGGENSTAAAPAMPIGPRDLRGTPPHEVRRKLADILEQLEQGGGGAP